MDDLPNKFVELEEKYNLYNLLDALSLESNIVSI